jgi:capsular polysaccharide transport system permease protein
VLLIFIVTDRVPPIGTQPIIFFGLSALPFVAFVYPSRQIVTGLGQNRPLLYFARVKIVDVIIARGLLETANGMAVSALVVVVLFLATGEFAPRDPFGILWALILTLYLGIAWGAYNALIAQLMHFWGYAFNLAFPLLWIGSGIVINVHGLPHQAGQYIAFNPLFQCVEYLRYSYYEGYPSDLLDVGYIFWFATCLLAVAFALERLLRQQLLSV